MSASTLKHLDPTRVELEISITPEEFDRAQDAAFRALSRTAKIPGFRPGKVPRRLFESQYGTAAIVDRALEDVVPKAYASAVQEHGIEPLARPEMELVGEDADGTPAPDADGKKPLRVKAVVPVRPEIEPKEYTDVDVTAVDESAADDDVDRALEQMRREAATLVPVDREARLGDVVVLDYRGSIDGVDFPGGTAEGEETELSAERFIPGFAEGIAGMRSGESKDVHARFPDGYGNRDLAGKNAVFAITLHEVKEPELPPVDDAFAARVSRQATLLELRGEIRGRLDAIARDKARRVMGQQLLDTIVARNEVPLPAVLVEREVATLMDDARGMIARSGLDWETYLEQSGKTEEALRAEFTEEAERRVRTTLLVEAIARKEGLTATQPEVEAELGQLAARYGQTPQQILELLRGDLSTVIDGIVRTKTVDWLLERARRVPAAPAGES